MDANDIQVSTVPEVAHILKPSRSKVYQMVERRELPAVHIGRSVRVLKLGLLRWIQEQREDNGNVLTTFGNTRRG